MNTLFRYPSAKIVNLALLLCLLCLVSEQCFAQTDSTWRFQKRGQAHVHYRKFAFPPKALLIQLRSEKRRIDYFENRNDLTNAQRVKKDAAEVRTVMTNDFRDHFTFCPVYYFIDTNAELVRQQKFDGVLLDAFGKPADKAVISPGDTQYYIVYYGYPENEKTESPVTREATYKYGSGDVMDKGLIFLDYRYQQRDYYFIVTNLREYFMRYLDPNYEFYSRKFDMEYRPMAKRYNADLATKFNGKPKANTSED